MTPAMAFYVTAWTAIGGFFAFCVFWVAEEAAERRREIVRRRFRNG